MRELWLVRHGRPDMPYDNPRCLGTTDLGLSTLGRLQSVLAGFHLRRAGVSTVFCSKLMRSCESARCMGYDPTPADGLQELHAGEWDGLYFDEIRARWPELYAARGKEPFPPPPGAEDEAAGTARFEAALRGLLAASDGNVAVVTHATVTGLFVCRALGLPVTQARRFRPAYGAITRFSFDGESFTLCGEPGRVPLPTLDGALCTALLRAAGTPPEVAAHCAAVAGEAMRICGELAQAGIFLDRETLYAAAMLHDILRLEPRHDAAGGDLIARLGYPKVAACIAVHHDCPFDGDLTEAAVLYIADKLTQGTSYVSLEARFEASLKKCKTEIALQKHGERFFTAKAIRAKINTFCEKDVI
ncbi:MAG TPA: histidine phosphatase family protein [Candidatus Acidoferrum sp.]|nr:histidine phosphatase family protein [Candidatus Acidoferrum sp.]